METIIRDERKPLEFTTIVGKKHIFSYAGSHFASTHSKFIIPCDAEYPKRDAEWNKNNVERKWKTNSIHNAVNLDEHTFVRSMVIGAVECRESTQEEIAEYYKVLEESNLAFREYSELSAPSIFSPKRVQWLRRDVFIKDKSKLRFRVQNGTKLYTIDNLADAAKELKAGQAFVWFSDNGYSYMGTDPTKIESIVEYVAKLTSGKTEFDKSVSREFVPRLHNFEDGYFAKGEHGEIVLRVGKDKHWSEVSNT